MPQFSSVNARQIQNVPVSATPPSSGDVLEFDGTQYTPTPGGGGGSITDITSTDTSVTVSNPTGPTTDLAVADSPAVGGVTVTGTPSVGQVVTATSASTADWQTPTGSGGLTPVDVSFADSPYTPPSNESLWLRVDPSGGDIVINAPAASTDGDTILVSVVQFIGVHTIDVAALNLGLITSNGGLTSTQAKYDGTLVAWEVAGPVGAFNGAQPDNATIQVVNGIVLATYGDVSTQTTPYTLAAQDTMILGDTTGGPITITLPAGPHVGKTYVIKKVSSDIDVVTVVTGTAALIDGAATFDLNAQYQTLSVIYDGVNFWVA